MYKSMISYYKVTCINIETSSKEIHLIQKSWFSLKFVHIYIEYIYREYNELDGFNKIHIQNSNHYVSNKMLPGNMFHNSLIKILKI